MEFYRSFSHRLYSVNIPYFPLNNNRFAGQNLRRMKQRIRIEFVFSKKFKNILKIPDLCKEVAKVGLLYSNHSQGKHKTS
jgi:hypothetical protein